MDGLPSCFSWKYGHEAEKVPDIVRIKAMKSYSDIVSDSAVERNKKTINGRTIDELWDEETHEKAVFLMSNISEEYADVNRIETVLMQLLEEEPEVLHTWKSPYLSSVKKLIRMYDYLRYKAKTP